jgi:hypothetical protein
LLSFLFFSFGDSFFLHFFGMSGIERLSLGVAGGRPKRSRHLFHFRLFGCQDGMGV